ncbi:hypothetical protein BDW59DRAFT_165375 [Aspergillus cavernicola]|uniref:Mid2 domain-containing protein n=1 Tax=Aspergillus cavernicola TaxID=176166 RepID=A0ABR4HVE8_9EURO
MTLDTVIRTAVAAASIMLMVAGTAAQSSTEVNILFPALNGMNMDNIEGSVVSADDSATTILIDCRSSVTNQCSSSGYVLPQTLTTGPSFQDYHYDSTLGASCYASTSTWVSSGLNATSSASSTSISISTFNFKYNTLAVSSGLEKLQPTETAASNASPGQTVTSTSEPTTTTMTTSEHGLSSKAWIAGPVVGAVVGLALVAAVILWYVGHRRKSDTDPLGGNQKDEISRVSELPSFLPRENVEVGELAGKSARAELSAQPNHQELP